MKSTKRSRWISIIKGISYIICVMCLAGYMFWGGEVSVETIIQHIPQNPLLAACILLLLYVVKSVFVVFPILILEIVGGYLFPIVPALFINNLGILICNVVAYWSGRFSGKESVEKLIERSDRFMDVVRVQNDNTFFVCLCSRMIVGIPRDLVSMYFGATQMDFKCYLVASTIGSLPSTVIVTLFGYSVTEPKNPLFWISLIIMGILTFGSYYICRRYSHKKKEGTG